MAKQPKPYVWKGTTIDLFGDDESSGYALTLEQWYGRIELCPREQRNQYDDDAWAALLLADDGTLLAEFKAPTKLAAMNGLSKVVRNNAAAFDEARELFEEAEQADRERRKAKRAK